MIVLLRYSSKYELFDANIITHPHTTKRKREWSKFSSIDKVYLLIVKETIISQLQLTIEASFSPDKHKINIKSSMEKCNIVAQHARYKLCSTNNYPVEGCDRTAESALMPST